MPAAIVRLLDLGTHLGRLAMHRFLLSETTLVQGWNCAGQLLLGFWKTKADLLSHWLAIIIVKFVHNDKLKINIMIAKMRKKIE